MYFLYSFDDEAHALQVLYVVGIVNHELRDEDLLPTEATRHACDRIDRNNGNKGFASV